jgi:hypothetical protein
MRYGLAGCDQAEQLDEAQFSILDAGCTQVGMPWTQTFCAFNPEHPGHWAYLRYQPDLGDGPREMDGKHFADVIHVKLNDGLDILTEQQRDKLDRMTGVLAQRLRFGRWVGFEGVVLDNWDPTVHIVDRPASWAKWNGYPPPSWPRYRGIDFGYVHPYACVWISESPEGYRYLYRQDLRQGLTIDQQVARILQFEGEELMALNIAANKMDANGSAGRARAENRDALEALNIAGSFSDHEAGHRAMFAAKGVSTMPANKEVQAGIETLRMALQPDREGTPAFMVVRGSLKETDRTLEAGKRPTSFESEAARWVWKTAKTSAGARTTKDMPVDVGEDAIKATIYALHTLATAPTVQAWL